MPIGANNFWLGFDMSLLSDTNSPSSIGQIYRSIESRTGTLQAILERIVEVKADGQQCSANANYKASTGAARG